MLFGPVLTRPKFDRFVTLFGSAILTTVSRTVANILRTVATLALCHVTTYQQVLFADEWSGLVLALIPANRSVMLVGDVTVEGHPGRKAHGMARHRDPALSSHGYAAWRYGLMWVALAAPVRYPWTDCFRPRRSSWTSNAPGG